MKIESLTMHRLDIPFRASFKHASAERSRTESVWVEARSTTGMLGCGEGCPRAYVTGEDVGSAVAFLARHAPSLRREVSDVESLRAWTRTHQAEIDAGPAAWCAIELALLDLIAREADVSIETALDLPELAGVFQYTAVIGDTDLETFADLFERFRAAGFRDYKLKLSGDLARDRARLHHLRHCAGAAARVRLDANNLWHDAGAAAKYLLALDGDLFAIEEPLRPGDVAGLVALSELTNLPVVLDESLLRAVQLAALPEPAGRWIANLRVSKLGGLLRALAVLDVARARGVRVIVGAQVGETSLLTRAALTVAARAGTLLAAQEGAFGTLLLARDVCEPVLQLGHRGRLDVSDALPGTRPGLGLAYAWPLPAPLQA